MFCLCKDLWFMPLDVHSRFILKCRQPALHVLSVFCIWLLEKLAHSQQWSTNSEPFWCARQCKNIDWEAESIILSLTPTCCVTSGKKFDLFSVAVKEHSSKSTKLFLLNTQRCKLTPSKKIEQDFMLTCFIFKIETLALTAVGCMALVSHHYSHRSCTTGQKQ